MDKQELIEKAVIHFEGKWIFPFKNLCTPAETNTCYEPHSKFESIRNVSELGPHWIFVCTKDEFNAAANRMRGKPDWKDAPEKKDMLIQDKHGDWHWCVDVKLDGPYEIIMTGVNWAGKGKVLGDWRDTLEKRPEHIGDANEKVEPEPAKPWFEAGELPPLGCFVDVTGFVVYGIGEKDCEVIAHVENCAVIRMSYGLGCFQAECLKPSMTDKEKTIEAAVKVCTGVNIATTTDGLTMKTLNKLYDAGLLRLLEEK